jgi:hypothetical protein
MGVGRASWQQWADGSPYSIDNSGIEGEHEHSFQEAVPKVCLLPVTHGRISGDNEAAMARGDPSVFLQEADRRRAEIAAEIAALGFALPGSLVERRGRCGKSYCRCHRDPSQLHGPYLSWTRKVNNKTVTRSVPAEEADRYREWMGNARRLRQLVAELEALAVRQVEGPSGKRGA